MLALNSLRTANSLILDVSRNAAGSKAANSSSLPLALTANRDAQHVVSESIFSVNYVDANELKINLMERVGKAFGFDLHDFADAGAMARQIDKIVEKMSPGEIMAMEKELGLDKLGVSLREVIGAMKEPGGTSDNKLVAALREQAGEILEDKTNSTDRGFHVSFDDIGRYST